MKFSPKRLILAAAAMACATQAASAALAFTNGDLILGFQATAGTGSTQNVFFNLGSPIAYRNGTNPSGTIGNINTTLTSVYGANWYTREDLYFGVVANLNGNANSGAGSRGVVNGDPSRTFYLSTAAATPGSGNLYAAGSYPSSTLGSAGTSLGGLEGIFPNLNTEADGAAILSQSTQPTEWNNGWTAKNITGGAAFGVFTGGIQQNFGKMSNSTYVDLQRVVSTNTTNTGTGYDGSTAVAGVIGGGTYETTFAISNTGNISAIPEPSTTLLGALGVIALLRRRRA
jgi:hypothetical protein